MKSMKLFVGVIALIFFFTSSAMAQELSTDQFKVLQSGTSTKSTIIVLVDQETLNDTTLIFNKGQLMTHNTSAYLFINTISSELSQTLHQFMKTIISPILVNCLNPPLHNQTIIQ